MLKKSLALRLTTALSGLVLCGCNQALDTNHRDRSVIPIHLTHQHVYQGVYIPIRRTLQANGALITQVRPHTPTLVLLNSRFDRHIPLVFSNLQPIESTTSLSLDAYIRLGQTPTQCHRHFSAQTTEMYRSHQVIPPVASPVMRRELTIDITQQLMAYLASDTVQSCIQPHHTVS